MRGWLISLVALLLVAFSIYFFKKHDGSENQEGTRTAEVKEQALLTETSKPQTASSEAAPATSQTAPSATTEKGMAANPSPTLAPTDAANATSSEKSDSPAEKLKRLLKGLNDEKIAQAFKLPREISLSPQQTEKLGQLEKKYTPTLTDLLTKMDGILSDDQKQARNEALLQSAIQGDRPDERNQILRKAMNLSGEQLKARMDLNRTFFQTRREIHQEIEQVLSPEQKQQLPPSWNRQRPQRF